MTESDVIKQIRKPSRFGRHPKAGYKVEASVWIEKDGELYLGGGRIMLLERVKKFGSLASAARSMSLTYRNAWLWIDAMNRLAPSPLVSSVKGGTGGGSAELTEEGIKAIEQYRKLRNELEQLLNSKNFSLASGADRVNRSGSGGTYRHRTRST